MDHTEEKPILAAPAADPDREARRKQGDFRTLVVEARGKQEENAIFLSPLPVGKWWRMCLYSVNFRVF